MVGSMQGTLDNISKDYSPETTSGPLYSNLTPGRTVRVQVAYDSTTVTLWTGYVDDLPQHPGVNKRSVGVPSLGSLSRLKGKEISTPLYQNIGTDEALGYILDAVGWSTSKRTLDSGQTTLLWWWADRADAFDAAVDVLASEGPGAALYEDGEGNIVFESRHYRIVTARCQTPQSTYTDITAEPYISPPVKYEPHLKNIINICEMETIVRTTAAAPSQVWEYGQTLNLAPGQTKELVVQSGSPFQAAINPTSSDGDYVVAAGGISTNTLDRQSGANCTLTMTATTNGATITDLQVRAYPLTDSDATLMRSTEASSGSQAIYGEQRYEWPGRPDIEPLVAQDFANVVVQQYQSPRPTISLKLVGMTSERIEECLSREISDRVQVEESQTGLNSPCYIEQIKHSIRDGVYHETEFGMEKILDEMEYAVVGSAKLGSVAHGESARLGW
jgi:hypothetical protein